MNHNHIVYDMDKHFVIDPITREITNAESKKNTLQQYDHNSEIFSFEVPRQVEGHDMTLCNRVEVHYINIDGSSRATSFSSVYEVQDLQIDPEDDDKVLFTWLVSSNATQYAGPLNFIISFMCTEKDEVTYRWNTGINKSISIASSMNNGEEIDERYDDILLQWYEKLFGIGETEETKIKTLSNSVQTTIRSLSNGEQTKIKNLSDKEQQNIKYLSYDLTSDIAKRGQATLDSIPEDYTTLNNEVEELVKTIGAYIPVEGPTINDVEGQIVNGKLTFRNIGIVLGDPIYVKNENSGYLTEEGDFSIDDPEAPEYATVSNLRFYKKGTLIRTDYTTADVIIFEYTEDGEKLGWLITMEPNSSYTIPHDCYVRIGMARKALIIRTPIEYPYFAMQIPCDHDDILRVSGNFAGDRIGIAFVNGPINSENESDLIYEDPIFGYNDYDGSLSENGDFEIYESTPPDDQTISELVFLSEGTKVQTLGTPLDSCLIYEYNQNGEKIGLLTTLTGNVTYTIPHDCYVRVGCSNGAGITASFPKAYTIVSYIHGREIIKDNSILRNVLVPENANSVWVFTKDTTPVVRKVLFNGDVVSYIEELKNKIDNLKTDIDDGLYEDPIFGYNDYDGSLSENGDFEIYESTPPDDQTISELVFLSEGTKVQTLGTPLDSCLIYEYNQNGEKIGLLTTLTGNVTYTIPHDCYVRVGCSNGAGITASFPKTHSIKESIIELNSNVKTFVLTDTTPMSDDSASNNEYCESCNVGEPLMISKDGLLGGSKRYFAATVSCEYGDVFKITGSFSSDYVGIVFVDGSSIIIDFKSGQDCVDNSPDLEISVPENTVKMYVFTLNDYPIVKKNQLSSVVVENLVDELNAIKSGALVDELTSKINALDAELTNFTDSEEYSSLVELNNYITENEDAINTLKTAIESSNGIIIGDAEPENYTGIWFNTSPEQTSIATLNLSRDGDSSVKATIDSVSYSVDNATSNGETTEEGKYDFTII